MIEPPPTSSTDIGELSLAERGAGLPSTSVSLGVCDADRGARAISQCGTLDLMTRGGKASLAAALCASAGLASWALVVSATPESPEVQPPGVIGIALDEGGAPLRGPVEAQLIVDEFGKATSSTLAISAFGDEAAPGHRVGIFLCGALRDGASIADINEGDLKLGPVPRTSVIMDSRLGELSSCSFAEATIATTRQLLLELSLDAQTLNISGARLAISAPGLVTLPVPYQFGDRTYLPLPEGSSTTVALAEPRSDLTVTSSRPQLPADGELAWTAEVNNGAALRRVEVRGTLSDAEQKAERRLFIGGALVGVSGGAFVWFVEEALRLAPLARRRFRRRALSRATRAGVELPKRDITKDDETEPMGETEATRAVPVAATFACAVVVWWIATRWGRSRSRASVTRGE